MKKKYIGILTMMLLLTQIVPVTASMIQHNSEPTVDETPTEPLTEGPINAKYGEICNYTATSEDPQGDPITYVIAFSDAPRSVNKQGPIPSGEEIQFSHVWNDFYQETNPYKVRVKAVDDEGHESKWARFITRVTDEDRVQNNNILDLNIVETFHRILEQIFNIDIQLNYKEKLFSSAITSLN